MNQLTAVEILLIEDNPAEMTQNTLKKGRLANRVPAQQRQRSRVAVVPTEMA
jgi:hypothetical protein